MLDVPWKRILPLLPEERLKRRGTHGGRPNADLQRTMDTLFMFCELVANRKRCLFFLGSDSVAHVYFHKWTQTGVFGRLYFHKGVWIR